MKTTVAIAFTVMLAGCDITHFAAGNSYTPPGTPAPAPTPAPTTPDPSPTPSPIPMPKLTSLTITLPATLVQNTSVALSASASDGEGNSYDVTAQVAWTASDPSIVTIAGAKLSGAGVGSAQVTATLGALSASATVSVTAPQLVSLTIAPATQTVPLGATALFTVAGNFDDGSTQDFTAAATWTTGDGDIASPDAVNGSIDTWAIGSTSVGASYNGLNASATLNVGNPVLSTILVVAGVPREWDWPNQAMAIAQYTDGSSADVTAMVQWSSMTPMASMDPSHPGLVDAKTSGIVTVQATMGDVIGNAQVVFEPKLVKLSIGGNATIPVGTCLKLDALFNYDDSSTQNEDDFATWGIGNPATATVSNDFDTAGTVCGVAAGTTTVTVTVGAYRAAATITVD